MIDWASSPGTYTSRTKLNESSFCIGIVPSPLNISCDPINWIGQYHATCPASFHPQVKGLLIEGV